MKLDKNHYIKLYLEEGGKIEDTDGKTTDEIINMTINLNKIDFKEVTCSYSRKVNLVNYESADYFCSMKAETHEEHPSDVYKKLMAKCKMLVDKDIINNHTSHEPNNETN